MTRRFIMAEQKDDELVSAYQGLDQIDSASSQIHRVLDLQTEISQELESRGFTYNEETHSWEWAV